MKSTAAKLSLVFLGLLGISSVAQAAPGAGVTIVGGRTMTFTPAQKAVVDKGAMLGTVSADKKTLTFRRKTVRLVVHNGPENDMLSYRIDGLRNPTLVVPVGAFLETLFINTDDDMTHNLRFTVQKPPFKGRIESVGTSNLLHKSETAYHAEEMGVRVPARPGTYYYFCTIPGHAPGGMYGTLIVR